MGHLYHFGKLQCPGLTTINGEMFDKSGAMAQAAANLTSQFYQDNPGADHDDARFHYKNEWKKAQIYGSITHRIIQRYLTTGKLYKSRYTAVQNAVVAFLSFVEDYQLEPVACEKIIHGNGWGSMIDCIGWITVQGTKKQGAQRLLYVLDWKTNKGFYSSEPFYQVAAYRATQPEADGCGVVRLDKETGKYEFRDTSGHKLRSKNRWEKDLIGFRNNLREYYHRHPRILKKAGYKEGGDVTNSR